MTDEIRQRAQKIKLLILDIDGVMSDGRIVYGDCGDELKFFDVQDGFGVILVKNAGIKVVIVTAKKSKIVKMRANELKVDALYQDSLDKLKALNKILKRFKLAPEEICFIGDDLVDAPILKRVGLAVSVPNGVEEVKSIAHMITSKTGGRGAVREVCDLILKSQNKWDSVTSKYLS